MTLAGADRRGRVRLGKARLGEAGPGHEQFSDRPPTAFWHALSEADVFCAELTGVRELQCRVQELEAEHDEAMAAAVGDYDCPCGSVFQFANDSTLEEYAALNRWLGRHFDNCDVVEAVHTEALRNENTRLRRDNQMLRKQADALLEVTAERDALASDLVDLRETHQVTVGWLAAAERELKKIRAAATQ